MDDTLQAAREAFQQRFQDLATQFRQNHAAWQEAVRANLATTSWVFRAFGDVSLAGTPRQGSGRRQRNSGSSCTVIYDIPAIVGLAMPSLAELARVIKAGACIEASFKRGKGEVGMDEYQVRTWPGWHHHMALTLIAVWFLIGETHRGQQVTLALTLPQVRYGLSVLLLEVFCTPGTDSICRQVQRQ